MTPKKKKKDSVLKKIIPKTTSEKILTLVFILLLVTVITLLCIAISKKNEYKQKQSADIVIPIVEKETNNTLNVDISELSENSLKDYSFHITNYKENNINKEEVSYSIFLSTNDNDVTLKLYKNGTEDNLLKDLTEYEVKDLKLEKNTKQDDVYTLIIKANKTIEKNQSIKIQIVSQQLDK